MFPAGGGASPAVVRAVPFAGLALMAEGDESKGQHQTSRVARIVVAAAKSRSEHARIAFGRKLPWLVRRQGECPIKSSEDRNGASV